MQQCIELTVTNRSRAYPQSLEGSKKIRYSVFMVSEEKEKECLNSSVGQSI